MILGNIASVPSGRPRNPCNLTRDHFTLDFHEFAERRAVWLLLVVCVAAAVYMGTPCT